MVASGETELAPDAAGKLATPAGNARVANVFPSPQKEPGAKVPETFFQNCLIARG
jgi:hypothetical protein